MINNIIYDILICIVLTSPEMMGINEDNLTASSASSPIMSEDEYSDHFDPAFPTAGRLHTPSDSEYESSTPMISCTDLDA